MLLIAILSGLAFFLLLYAVYNYLRNDSIAVSKRVRQFGNDQHLRRASSKDGFWYDLANSRVNSLARIAAGRFGSVLPKRAWFELQASQAGLPVTGGELLMLVCGSAVAAALLTLVLTFSPLRAVIIGVAWIVFCVIYLQILARRRMKNFDDQLGDAIVMMSNALKAGFTFQQAMDIVSKELGDPISTEFGRALNEVQLGVPLEDALNSIHRRIKSEDFELLITAVVIQRQVGGNLAQILDTIGSTIRERLRLKGEIKSLTAEGVMSGWIIGLLPIGLSAVLLMMNPTYFDGLLKESFGKALLIGALVSELIGALIIKKIVNMRI